MQHCNRANIARAFQQKPQKRSILSLNLSSTLNFLSIIIALSAAYFSYSQANIAKKTMIYSNVAAVIMGEAHWLYYPDGLHFIDGWQNAGNTATVGMTENVNFSLNSSPMRPGFSYNNEPSPSAPISIGPKSTLGVDEFTIPTPCIYDMTKSPLMLYVWGVARYNDLFKSAPHITRFCWIITDIVRPEVIAPGTPVTVDYRLCDEGNCIDTECQVAPTDNPSLPPAIQCAIPAVMTPTARRNSGAR